MFFTEVEIPKSKFNITHKDKILLVGSCFTQEIGTRLEINGFDVLKNPFGVIYNPLSIAGILMKSVKNEKFTISDVVKSNQMYYLFQTHGDIRGYNSDECLNSGNKIIEQTHNFLQQTSFVIITLGTAWSYWYKNGDILCANCHKLPQKNFDRKLLSVEQCVSALNDMIKEIKNINSDVRFIFTVSPVRHIKEGFYDNKISKSVLALAVDKIIKQESNYSEYFPAYEIVNDQLRDYRFYAKDMVHINEIAVDYIWEKFCGTYFDANTVNISSDYLKLWKMKNHRPFNTKSEEYDVFLKKIQLLEEKLSKTRQ